MRILVLCYEFPPIGGGGGRVAEDLCRYFVIHGHKVLVHSSGFTGIPDHEEKFGFTIKRTYAFRRRKDRCTILEMFLYVITNIVPTLYFTIKWKPQIIHCHFAVPTGVIASVTSFLTRIPYVVTAHLGDVPGGVPEQTSGIFKIVKPFTKLIWEKASAITAVSDHVANLAREAYKVPVKTIVNGIDILPIKGNQNKIHSPIKLVFAGRFNAQKNLLFLVDLLNQVSDIDWTANLIGDGDMMPQIRNAVEKYNLANRVYFHGWQPPDKVDEIMAECDILLLPSFYEGMPVVGVKALLFGLAILASDIDGLNGIVYNNVNGYLCPVNDLYAFDNAFRKMIVDKEVLNTMKAKSLELSVKFDLSNISAEYEMVFQKVV